MQLQNISECASLTQDFRTLPGDTCPDVFVVQVEAPVNIGVSIHTGSDEKDLDQPQCESAELTLTLLENNAVRNVLSTTVENGEFCQRSGGLICDIQCNFETGLGLALDGLTMNGLGNSVLAIADVNQAGLGFNVSARSISGLCDPGDIR